MEYLVAAICAVIVAEAGVAALIHWLKRDCPWLITQSDLAPTIDEQGLRRFIEHGWDAELGWARKPNTSHPERGTGGRETRYTIDETGARSDPGMATAPAVGIACGDSYTFCRQVNDDETWPHFLSQATGQRFANIGVGNYGLDQSLLRLEREFTMRDASVAIMGVVPETICRVQGMWKHFSEYGNVFAFKPRFHLTADGTLDLMPSPIDTPEGFFRIAEMLDHLKKNDRFYDLKFRHDLLRMPYLFHVALTWRRTSRLAVAALSDRLHGGGRRAFAQVMRRNIEISAAQYRDPAACALLAAIIRRFAAIARQNGATPILLFIPQLLDLEHLRSGNHFYSSFLTDLADDLDIVDMGPALAGSTDDAEMYIDDLFGGHLSPKGNALVADKLLPLVSNKVGSRAAAG